MVDFLFAVILVSVGYYGGAMIGGALTFKSMSNAVPWPPSSVLLGALLLSPLSSWWMLLVIAFVAHFAAALQVGGTTANAFAQFICNCSEALIGAIAVRGLFRQRWRLDFFRTGGLFLCVCGFLAPFLFSFLDVVLVTLNGWEQDSNWQLYRVRFFTHVLAMLALVPVLVIWNGSILAFAATGASQRYLRQALWVLALLMAGNAIFVAEHAFHAGAALNRQLLLYAPLLVLLWATLMFNALALSVSFVSVIFVATWGGLQGNGAFITGSAATDALSVQLFLIGISVLLLLLSNGIQEYRRAHEALRFMEEKFRSAFTAASIEARNWIGAVNRMQAENGRYEIRFHPVRPYGEVRWVTGKAAIQCDSTATLMRMSGVNPVITERKRHEAKARYAEDVEQTYVPKMQSQHAQLTFLARAATLGELSGALAHELNQPLTAILSNAQAARRFMAEDTSDLQEIRDILTDIIDDDKRAAGIIRRLRALFTGDGPKLEPFDLNRLISETLDLAHSYLITRNVKVMARLHPGLLWVQGDQVQLQQVLLNIILNACQAMSDNAPDKREMVLRTGVGMEGVVWATLSDTGSGIPANVLDRIFDSFCTTKLGGTGLGLSISHSIITQHGGSIEAMNNPDCGATFRITLPHRGRA